MPRFTFDELPVGACFAFDPTSKHATRRKVDARSSIIIPGGKRPLRVEDIDTRVHLKTCPMPFGRRRRRKNKRSR
jgi:hypothetical protein